MNPVFRHPKHPLWITLGLSLSLGLGACSDSGTPRSSVGQAQFADPTTESTGSESSVNGADTATETGLGSVAGNQVLAEGSDAEQPSSETHTSIEAFELGAPLLFSDDGSRAAQLVQHLSKAGQSVLEQLNQQLSTGIPLNPQQLDCTVGQAAALGNPILTLMCNGGLNISTDTEAGDAAVLSELSYAATRDCIGPLQNAIPDASACVLISLNLALPVEWAVVEASDGSNLQSVRPQPIEGARFAYNRADSGELVISGSDVDLWPSTRDCILDLATGTFSDPTRCESRAEAAMERLQRYLPVD